MIISDMFMISNKFQQNPIGEIKRALPIIDQHQG